MAIWIATTVTASCGHEVEAKLPHPEFEGEQVRPEVWRREMGTVPCTDCFRKEQEAARG